MLIKAIRRGPGDKPGQDILLHADGSITAWHSLLFALGLSPCLMQEHKCASCPASAYVTVQTQYRDQACLVAALQDLGYVVETHKEAVSLYGYHGDERPEKAHVIVRRQHVGNAANDLGWVKQPDGSFSRIRSEYDGRSTFTDAKEKKLSQRYAFHKVSKTAKAKGYTVSESQTQDGSIKLKLRRY